METTTTTHRKAAWGLAPTDATRLHWGGRGIWKGYGRIDLPFDRMDFVKNGADPEVSKAFSAWIHRAIDSFVMQIDNGKIRLGQRENREIAICGDGYRLRLNPNASYGYLYLCAEPDEGEISAERFPLVAPKATKATKAAGRRSRSAR